MLFLLVIPYGDCNRDSVTRQPQYSSLKSTKSAVLISDDDGFVDDDGDDGEIPANRLSCGRINHYKGTHTDGQIRFVINHVDFYINEAFQSEP